MATFPFWDILPTPLGDLVKPISGKLLFVYVSLSGKVTDCERRERELGLSSARDGSLSSLYYFVEPLLCRLLPSPAGLLCISVLHLLSVTLNTRKFIMEVGKIIMNRAAVSGIWKRHRFAWDYWSHTKCYGVPLGYQFHLWKDNPWHLRLKKTVHDTWKLKYTGDTFQGVLLMFIWT